MTGHLDRGPSSHAARFTVLLCGVSVLTACNGLGYVNREAAQQLANRYVAEGGMTPESLLAFIQDVNAENDALNGGPYERKQRVAKKKAFAKTVLLALCPQSDQRCEYETLLRAAGSGDNEAAFYLKWAQWEKFANALSSGGAAAMNALRECGSSADDNIRNICAEFALTGAPFELAAEVSSLRGTPMFSRVVDNDDAVLAREIVRLARDPQAALQDESTAPQQGWVRAARGDAMRDVFTDLGLEEWTSEDRARAREARAEREAERERLVDEHRRADNRRVDEWKREVREEAEDAQRAYERRRRVILYSRPPRASLSPSPPRAESGERCAAGSHWNGKDSCVADSSPTDPPAPREYEPCHYDKGGCSMPK